MSTLQVPSMLWHDVLKPGDRITHIDGHALGEDRVVDLPRVGTHFNGPDAVRLVNARGTETEWNLYPGNHDEVTVERETPLSVRGGQSVEVTDHAARKAIEEALDAQEAAPLSPDLGPRRWTGAVHEARWTHQPLPGPRAPERWGKRARTAFMRNHHYARLLRDLLDGPIPSKGLGRGLGTQYGTLAAYYGWVERAGNAWQITDTGRAVLAAWERDRRQA